jgi:hypothetical protein
MAQTAINEVEVLRFFETESLDKATVLFNIVQDKMRTRLQGGDTTPSSNAPKKRRSSAAKPDIQEPEVSEARST